MPGWTNLTPSAAALAAGNAYLFEDAGALKYQGTSGSAVTVVNADGTTPLGTGFGSLAIRTANGTASTSAQNLLESTNDEYTVAANREYFFEGLIVATSAIVSSVPTAPSFLFGGTATISSVDYTFIGHPETAGTSVRVGRGTVATAVQLATTAGSATTFTAKVSGLLVTSGAGTIIPQVITSSSPSTMRPDTGSWFKFINLGPSADKVFGAGGWS